MAEWYFRDKAGKVQGPFTNEEMRAWYEAGWLAADLPVARGDPRSNPFRSLAEHFPNGSSAFLEEEEDESEGRVWYFLDRNHQQQGPFTDMHMRQWHMAGYFEPTLMVIDVSTRDAKWRQLREYFPNYAEAFTVESATSSPSRPPAQMQHQNSRPKLGEDSRFKFPERLPVPPRYRGVKKVYPSEKGGGKRRVALQDVNGKAVENFRHIH